MPIYEYQCSNCGHTFDELQKMSEESLTTCPKCGRKSLQRLIGSGAGVIFKGSGFYHTDYKKKSSQYKKHAETTVKHDKKTESKPDIKTETKKSSKDKNK